MGAQGYSAFGRGETKRISQHVPEYLVQTHRVALDPGRRGGEFEADVELLLVSLCSEAFPTCAKKRMQIDRTRLKTQLPVRDSREIQEIVNEASLHFDVLADGSEIVTYIRWEIGVPLPLARQQQRGVERSSQLVGKRGQEIVLGLGSCLSGLLGFLQRQFRFFGFCNIPRNAHELWCLDFGIGDG